MRDRKVCPADASPKVSDVAVLILEREFIEEKTNWMKPEIGNLRSLLNYELSSATLHNFDT